MAFFNDEAPREKHLRRGTCSLIGGGGTSVCLTVSILSAIPFAGWVALAVVGAVATVSLLSCSMWSFFKAYKNENLLNVDSSKFDSIERAAGALLK